MSKLRIITHGGMAHADEFLAIAVILARHDLDYSNCEAVIERRDPKPEELDNPDIYVVDVGGRYEPDLRNYDHHQGDDPRVEGKCALDLVLEGFGLTEKANRASKWLEFKSSLDCYGPGKTAEKMGMSVDALFATLSPIEGQVLKLFEQDMLRSSFEFRSLAFELLMLIGDGLLSYWKTFDDQLLTAHSATQLIVRDHLFLDFRCCNGGEPLLPAVMFSIMDELNAAGSITADNRGEGCEFRAVLYRHNDNPAVDFTRVCPGDAHFIHKNGFLLKTQDNRDDIESIRSLLDQAIQA